jgi:hypothetical protein
MRFGHEAGLELPLHVSQWREGDARGATFAFADRRRQLAGCHAFCRKHLFLHYADTDAPSAREAAPPYMHTNGTGARCRRICIRNASFVADRVDTNDCRTSVACFGFQSASRRSLVQLEATGRIIRLDLVAVEGRANSARPQSYSSVFNGYPVVERPATTEAVARSPWSMRAKRRFRRSRLERSAPSRRRRLRQSSGCR